MKTPIKLWHFCANYVSHLRNHIVRPLIDLNGRTPYEKITGNTPDISELLEFEWYQPIWYYEPSEFPHQNKLLGRWIGIAHRIGQALCFWILPFSGIPIARATVQAISKEDLLTDVIKDKLLEFDQSIEQKLYEGRPVISDFSLYREDEDPSQEDSFDPIEPEAQAPEIGDIEQDAFDELLPMEPTLIREGVPEKAKIIGRKRDPDGNLVGHYDSNPLLNTRIYLAEFPDGNISKYSTKAWRICVMWNNNSTSWHPLADIKNSFPVQLAQYAISNKLDQDTAFRWWIKPTLKHKESFLKAVKSKYSSRTHKFGIRVPTSVEEALAINKETNTTFLA